MTYYLQYRPQTIASLDLASVRTELGAVLTSGRFAHAYLFSGPRGTGKTSAARILAKVVNCKRNARAGKTKRAGLSEPCNTCISCRAITQGNALDLIEIDAASNRGIDDIRELRERIRLAPTQSRYKVYIIDEVHMLTTEAFNALLKTLEEPPEHALFILATTAPEKLPGTVISRCTQIKFAKASVKEVVLSLSKVVKGEKLRIDPIALEMIAQAVDGSFRDGMKVLEQLSLRTAPHTSRSRKITVDDVSQVMGLGDGDAVRKLLNHLAKGETEPALLLVSEVVRGQVSIEQFLREILELLRRLLLTEAGVMEETPVANLSLMDIRTLISIYMTAAGRLRTAVIPELPLELAVVEWIDHRGRQPLKSGDAGTKAGEVKTEQEHPTVKKGVIRVSLDEVKEHWPEEMLRVRPQNHSLEALLKAAVPLRIDNNGSLIIEVAYAFHKQQLELSRYKAIVEEAVREVLSTRLKLQYILRDYPKAENPKVLKEHDNVSGAVEDEDVVRAAHEIFGVESD